MQTMTASKARASFGKVARKVLKTRKPVFVATREGVVQIAPCESDDVVPPAPPDSLKHTEREIELSNTFGETL